MAQPEIDGVVTHLKAIDYSHINEDQQLEEYFDFLSKHPGVRKFGDRPERNGIKIEGGMKNPLWKEIGHRVQLTREKLKLLQKDMAKELDDKLACPLN